MRVLIVEDDVSLGGFLQKGLKLEGHDVEWVGDGDAGLRQANANRPDLIVLDLSLPKKDGTEVLAEMRGRFDGTAVLVLTGRSDVNERVRCLNLGADDCLLKPFSFPALRGSSVNSSSPGGDASFGVSVTGRAGTASPG